MISVQEIIASWIGAEGFTPVMVYPEESPFVYDGKCIRRVDIHHIHHPHLKVLKSSCEPVIMMKVNPLFELCLPISKYFAVFSLILQPGVVLAPGFGFARK